LRKGRQTQSLENYWDWSLVIKNGRLKWFGRVELKDNDDWLSGA